MTHVLGCICLNCQPETRSEDMYAALFAEVPAAVPTVGMTVDHAGVTCRIFKVRPFGTIDVQEIGGEGRCWRLSGLSF